MTFCVGSWGLTFFISIKESANKKIIVNLPNPIDTSKFRPIDRKVARENI